LGRFWGSGGGVYAGEAGDADCLGGVDDESVAERGEEEGKGKGEKRVGEVHFGRVNGFCTGAIGENRTGFGQSFLN